MPQLPFPLRFPIKLANAPGIIRTMNANPGAAKRSAPSQCHPHTFMAQKKEPTVSGNENLNTRAATSAVIAHPEPQ